MKTDTQLKADVLAEMKWEPSINEKLVSVEVNNGVVTLVGHMESYEEKWHTLEAAKRVYGLKALTDEIDVSLPSLVKRDDLEITQSAKDLLKWMTYFPKGRVSVLVKDGWIILKGELDWDFQRYVVSTSMRHLIGVAGVINQISIKPKELWNATNIESDRAITFNRSKNTQSTFVDISDSRVTVTSSASKWLEPMLVNQPVSRVVKHAKKNHKSAVHA
jgi:osmotically-inducible protein OsmY